MTPFEHLSVLISIVIGLGITHLLMSAHRLVQARDRIRPFWLSLLWAVLIFISQVEWWWASFTYRDQVEWNFFYFLFILSSPVALFLAAAFVLPDIEEGRTYDLEEYYFDTRGWFFGILAVSPALDAVRRALQAGSWHDFGAMSNAVSAGLLVTMAISRREWYHGVLTIAVAGLFLYFIVAAALRLG